MPTCKKTFHYPAKTLKEKIIVITQIHIWVRRSWGDFRKWGVLTFLAIELISFLLLEGKLALDTRSHPSAQVL